MEDTLLELRKLSECKCKKLKGIALIVRLRQCPPSFQPQVRSPHQRSVFVHEFLRRPSQERQEALHDLLLQ